MSNAMVTQWIEMSQDALKKISDAQKNNINNLSQNQPFDVGSAAEIMKASMESFKEANKDNVSTLNTLISNQATSLKLNVSAQALQQFTEVMGTLANNVIQQQTKLTADCMKPFTTILTSLSEVKNPDDLTNLQTTFAQTLGSTLKEGAMENAKLLTALQTAMTAWTEKTLDNTTGNTSDV